MPSWETIVGIGAIAGGVFAFLRSVRKQILVAKAEARIELLIYGMTLKIDIGKSEDIGKVGNIIIKSRSKKPQGSPSHEESKKR